MKAVQMNVIYAIKILNNNVKIAKFFKIYRSCAHLLIYNHCSLKNATLLAKLAFMNFLEVAYHVSVIIIPISVGLAFVQRILKW